MYKRVRIKQNYDEKWALLHSKDSVNHYTPTPKYSEETFHRLISRKQKRITTNAKKLQLTFSTAVYCYSCAKKTFTLCYSEDH